MRRMMIALTAILLASLPAAAQEPKPLRPRLAANSCIECHSQFEDELLEPTLHVKEDIHFQKELACHDCHGGNPEAGGDGDPEAAHDPAHGFRGKPSRADTPKFCARCHADATYMKRFNPHARVDQLSEYRTSRHGMLLATGDDRVAICTDCHGVHGIRAIKDPRSSVHPTRVADTCSRCHSDPGRMEAYGLPTDQFASYRTSVHAGALYDQGDLSAPTCNDCHGSHGAVPPGVAQVSNVCGSCHGREATLFREVEERKGINLSACIQCMICHGNHAVQRPNDDMLGVGPRSSCTSCHPEGDKNYGAIADMGEAVTTLVARLGEADDLIDQAEIAGMEVGPDRFALQKARDQLVEARVLAHGFDRDRFIEVTDEGIAAADAGIVAGRRAFADLRFRRTGLALSLVVIAAVIIALAMKIKDLERQKTV